MNMKWLLTLIMPVALGPYCKSQEHDDRPGEEKAINPLIWADIPDMSVVRKDSTYYMSSTTMHMNPHVPIMKSRDLVNWEIISYALDTLGNTGAFTLSNGRNDYGRGSWASSLRFHDSTWYVSTFSHTTGRTYISSTGDIEKGPWKTVSFSPCFHDNTLFFDDDGRIYIVYGTGKLKLIELNENASGVKPGAVERVIIENASAPAGDNIMLPAEGSQLFKINGTYYLFNIAWPRGGMRTVIIHRAINITGPWTGRLVLQDKGVAQGGIVDTPEGKWFAYLFRDFGSVGRIPYLVPVTWIDGWPFPGKNGHVPDTLDLPSGRGPIPGIVISDDFLRRKGEPPLPLAWQWNHNPDNSLWSLTERPGFLRLKSSRRDTIFTQARNTLTQRTFGPECSGSTLVDISRMKDGDFAGLALLQKKFGQVGVIVGKGKAFVIMVNAQTGTPITEEILPVNAKEVYLKTECDYRDLADTGYFFYSLDGKKWTPVGTPLKMEYSMPHFMGYRFGLFFYSTENPGGSADFDWFRISPGRDQTPSPEL